MKKEKVIKGVALLITLVFVIILGIGAVAIARLHSMEISLVRRQNNSTKAFYLAEAGLNKAGWYLTHTAPDGSTDGSWYTTAYPANPGDGDNDSKQETLSSGTYTGTYTMWVRDSKSREGWTDCKKITIYHTKVFNTNQSDFPVLIHTKDPAWKDTNNGGLVAQANGGDILFTDSDGTTQLNHEIEKYTPSTGELIAWVEVPTLSASTDTVIYIFYGNATCSNQESPAGVWDSNYVMVQHLQETDIDGGSGDIKDSTSNANNGTTSGMDTDDQVAGQINGSLEFDGVDDYVSVDTAVGDLASTTTGTWTAWVKPVDATPANHEEFIAFGDTNADEIFQLLMYETTGVLYANLKKAGTVQWALDTDDSPFSDNAWTHIALVQDGTEPVLYVDGGAVDQTFITTTDKTVWFLSATGLDNGRIGDRNFNNGGETSLFNGTIDEVRISNVARSADWIATSYYNQNSPSSFYIVEREATIYARGTVDGLTRVITITQSIGTPSSPEVFNYALYVGKHIHTTGADDFIVTGDQLEGGTELPTPNLSYYKRLAGMVDQDISGNHTFTAGTYYGIWYVDGNVTINSNVTINGSVIATGKITTGGNSYITITATSPYPALVANGNFDFKDSTNVTVNGATYVGADLAGNFLSQRAENISFTGTLIVAGNFNLQNSKSIHITYDPSIVGNPPPGFVGITITPQKDWKEI